MLFKQFFWWIFKFLLVLNLLLHFLQTECLFSKCCFKLLLSVNFLLQIWHLISLHILTCSPISIEVVKVWLHFEHVQFSVETNIRIYSNIRIFSSEYWYSYSIRGHFQNPNIIRIFEYFGLNIQKLFDGKILEFLGNKDKIWTIFCEQGVDL